MSESNRKKRQRQRQSPLDALAQHIREVVSRHPGDPGVSVQVHESGRFETLSFEIQVPMETAPAAAVELSNELLAVADRSALDELQGWEWMISVSRGAEQLIDLEPGDDLQIICTVCERIQSQGEVCEDCQSQLPEVSTG